MFEDVSLQFAQVNEQTIAYRRMGDGPPVLLLHGYPQTHALWAQIAPLLANRFTIVMADLRGYGDSSKPEGLNTYTFRHIGTDQLALMAHLGFERFHLVGHDRGARTAHRMALDAPDCITSLTLMDIVPTHHLLADLRKDVARAYYHWFFLAQPAPFPENLILSNPDRYYETCLTGWGHATLSDFDADQLAAYRSAWRDPETTRAMCDDYRATLDLDFELDAADLDRQVACPTLVLWGADGAMGKMYDVAATWSPRLANMTARSLPGGHFFLDQYPQETADALLSFLPGPAAGP
ncbi:alpha/beta fold hydrolase [Shimia aestuarii]|uniref:Haloacetate dehalogenase n=1 Tax=Shimia aestuarii TaxID=254406 RepID=A0A1I4LE59_9RHOB|nr:alpha/beta hydrolase [Shimia aestuarii]SFL89136.1 haloacetate dehalogenase [Shimia aestuarii]